MREGGRDGGQVGGKVVIGKEERGAIGKVVGSN